MSDLKCLTKSVRPKIVNGNLMPDTWQQRLENLQKSGYVVEAGGVMFSEKLKRELIGSIVVG